MVRSIPFGAALAALAVILVLGGGVPQARAGGGVAFLAGLEDVPVMPGLTEATDGAMVFDTPAGRIVETYATGTPRPAGILDFYRETLPQLGWQAAGGQAFLREGEILRLDFPAVGKAGTTVRFTLSPAEGR